MSQAYYRKWRPQGWDEVIGQEHVIRTLHSALAQGNLAHAYLFPGRAAPARPPLPALSPKRSIAQLKNQPSAPATSVKTARRSTRDVSWT